jgi:hypothetical protein
MGASVLNLVQVYPQFKNFLSAIEQFCINQTRVYCDFFVMRDKDRNMQSLCEACRRQQGTGNVAFFYGICPRGRTRGL